MFKLHHIQPNPLASAASFSKLGPGGLSLRGALAEDRDFSLVPRRLWQLLTGAPWSPFDSSPVAPLLGLCDCSLVPRIIWQLLIGALCGAPQ